MKKTFSTYWNSSKQPRKQRKYLAKAPLHTRHKFLNASLSKELRKKYNKRSLSVRKGDTVKIISGKFKKKQGKVLNVSLMKLKVVVEGIQIKKQDGSKINLSFHPSNLQIVELNLDDKERLKKIQKKEIKSENKKIETTKEK